MDSTQHPARFALYDDDGLAALVADGLPRWPDDNVLSGIDDTALGEMERAYLAEFERLAADDSSDLTVMSALAQQVGALRTEAAARLAAAETPPAPAPTPDPTPAPQPAADREAALAALRDTLGPPAAEPPAPPAPEPGATIEPTPAFSAADLAAAVSAAAEAGARAAVTAMAQAIPAPVAPPAPEPIPAEPRRVVRATDLAQFRRQGQEEMIPATARTNARLVTTAEFPSRPLASTVESIADLRDIYMARFRDLGHASGVNEEKVTLATARVDVPEERNLKGLDWTEARRKVLAAVGPQAVGINPYTGKEALVASGGLAAPVEPYYPQLVIAQGARPTLEALPSFVADRGGIRLVLPPSLGSLTAAVSPGTFSDGVTNATTTFTSATANFTAADVGKSITSAGNIPAGTLINSVTNATTVVLSAAATTSATGVTFYMASRNPNNLGAPVALQTVAQDAAGGSIKYTFDVPLGAQAEFDVYAVYTSLQFGNITARTFPEQVEANIRLADALAARIAEQQMLDTITNWSTLFTGAKTFGTARQLLAQWDHMAAYYRNHNRMDPAAILRLGIPAWSINAMRADYISTFMDGSGGWGLSDAEIAAWFAERSLMPFLYQDGPSDISQLFAAPPSSAVNTGSNTATPVAIPEFPGQGATTAFRTKVVSYMFAEGTWLALTTGELNLGLVRDSVLNSQNKFRSFQEEWESPAFVGVESLRATHTVASDGSYGAAAAITLGAGSGL